MSTTTLSIDDQMDLLLRGAAEVYTKDDLHKRLQKAAAAGRPLRVKLGLDPTAPDIHLGHTVVLRKLRQFQDCGHKAVLIIGDFTARIGDPSGKTKARPALDEETIKANAETYFQQAGHVLDTDPAKLEVVYNSTFLSKLGLADILRLTSHITVAQMLQRENFKERMLGIVAIILTSSLGATIEIGVPAEVHLLMAFLAIFANAFIFYFQFDLLDNYSGFFAEAFGE